MFSVLYEVGFLRYVEIFLEVEVWEEVFIMMEGKEIDYNRLDSPEPQLSFY